MSELTKSSARAKILIVDDEASVRDSLRMILEYEGYRVGEAATGGEALTRIRQMRSSVVLLDIKMPEMDGLEVLRSFRERGYDMPVLIITGHGDVATAVEATRAGAFDFLQKPLERDRVLLSVRNALEAYQLKREKDPTADQDELVGSSPIMRQLRDTIGRAAPTPATVLITGESGTGKELVARAIHRLSNRKDKPLVQVNCAAIPEELIESELFGHEKGSFTGAIRKQLGKFVAANGGTIFLDEIGDMSSRTQAKVLRVLQNGEVESVGSHRLAKVDVRVVAATNRDLEEEIEQGRFREDLFYRLNVIPIRTPALREHLEDVPEFVEYFVRRFSEANNYRIKSLDPDAMEHLKSLPWKGNVRELKNILERLLILSPGDNVTKQDIVAIFGSGRQELGSALLTAGTLREFRETSERLFLLDQLQRHAWNVTRTSKAIETPRSNLYKKMDQYGIQREGRKDGA